MSVHIPSYSAVGSATPLDQMLGQAIMRIRMLRLLRFCPIGAASAAWIGVVLAGLSKLNLFPTPSALSMAFLLLAGLIAGAVAALAPRLDPLDVARITERRADLKERLSSALEMPSNSPFQQIQRSDADRYAGQIALKRLYPARASRSIPLALFGSITLFSIYFLPGLPLFWSAAKKNEMAQVRKEGIRITHLAKTAEHDAMKGQLEQTKKAAAAMRKLGILMREGKLDKEHAMLAMRKLTVKMENQIKKDAQQPSRQAMQQAAKQFKKSLDKLQQAELNPRNSRNKQPPNSGAPKKLSQNNQAMQQAVHALQKMQQAMAMQSPGGMQQAMQQMAQSMQKGGMSPQQMQQLSQAMQKLSQAMQNAGMSKSAQQMAQLAQAMQNASMSGMSQSEMNQLAQMMNQIGMGMTNGGLNGKALMDAEAMQSLLQSLQKGRLTLAYGNSFGLMFGLPGMGPGMGGMGPGNGAGGHGTPFKAMKDPGITHPKLMALGPGHSVGTGKNGSVKQFLKYLQMGAGKSAGKHMPNGMIPGTRSKNGQELSIQTLGAPDHVNSSLPYYQAVETSQKQAASALSRERVPAAMRQQVKDYFDTLHGGKP